MGWLFVQLYFTKSSIIAMWFALVQINVLLLSITFIVVISLSFDYLFIFISSLSSSLSYLLWNIVEIEQNVNKRPDV